MLLSQPRREIGIDPLGERDEFVVLMDGEADKRDQVREDAFAGRALNLGFLQRRVGLPKLRFVPEVRRLFNGIGQFLDPLKRETLLVGLL